MTTDPVYTLKEAAQVMGVSHSTIRRRHKEQAFPNAYKDPDGVWKLTLSDLRQAGLRPPSSERVRHREEHVATVTLTSGQDRAHSPTPPLTQVPDPTDELRAELHRTQLKLAEEQGFRRGLEGTLEESRERNRELTRLNRELTQALLQIESKVTQSPEPTVVVGETVPLSENPAPTPAPAAPAAEKRKRWWNR